MTKTLDMVGRIQQDSLIDITLRVPRRAVVATDPPADPARLPRERSEYKAEVPVDGQLEIELVHPWLRNEAGDVLFGWSIWAAVKWGTITIVALFSDRVRDRLLSPAVDLLFNRRRERRQSAGFIGDQ